MDIYQAKALFNKRSFSDGEQHFGFDNGVLYWNNKIESKEGSYKIIEKPEGLFLCTSIQIVEGKDELPINIALGEGEDTILLTL